MTSKAQRVGGELLRRCTQLGEWATLDVPSLATDLGLSQLEVKQVLQSMSVRKKLELERSDEGSFKRYRLPEDPTIDRRTLRTTWQRRSRTITDGSPSPSVDEPLMLIAYLLRRMTDEIETPALDRYVLERARDGSTGSSAACEALAEEALRLRDQLHLIGREAERLTGILASSRGT
jgi:hypothetical protein